MTDSKAPPPLLSPFQWSLGALATVIVAYVFDNFGQYGSLYFIGLFAVVGLVPTILLAAKGKKKRLDQYRSAVSQFAIWLSAILATNMFTSALNIFKIAPLIGLLAFGLFFVFVLTAARLLKVFGGFLTGAEASASRSK